MDTSSRDEKQRNREIAHNEAERQTIGDVRVSAWTIAFVAVVGVVAFALAWAWIYR